MDFYHKELTALKRAGRYRERIIYDETLVDLASNDYLGLSENKLLAKRAGDALMALQVNAPKASMLVNGYHPVHARFEQALCEANGFESGIILGSGFNANIALIEALVRKGDTLFIDEKYHASGVLASRLCETGVIFFRHNDVEDLKAKLSHSEAKRKIVAVEGIYSMDGDRCKKEIIEVADDHDAILIMDEAHSSGVIGPNLMGIFDDYAMPIRPNYIKMGTLGKAYGSFGAYILATSHIVEYLVNRAKPVIYATAPSLFDTLLGHEALHYIQENRTDLIAAIKRRQNIVEEETGQQVDGLIVPIVVNDNRKVMSIREVLLSDNILVGAIRQPTVEQAIIRLIARIGVDPETLRSACQKVIGAL